MGIGTLARADGTVWYLFWRCGKASYPERENICHQLVRFHLVLKYLRYLIYEVTLPYEHDASAVYIWSLLVFRLAPKRTRRIWHTRAEIITILVFDIDVVHDRVRGSYQSHMTSKIQTKRRQLTRYEH